MDLTRRLRVLSTPTVLVLDALGGITSRASGPLRKADLLAAVGAVARTTDGSALNFPLNQATMAPCRPAAGGGDSGRRG